MRLLYWKICLFLSFASIEDIINLRHVCSSFFSRPVQTSHHPLNRQQDNVHPLRVSRKQSYQLFSFCCLLSQNCPSMPRMLSLSGIWFWLGFPTIQCGIFLLSWCCSCTFQISDTPFLVTTWYTCDASCRYKDFFCIFMQVAFPYITLHKLPYSDIL